MENGELQMRDGWSDHHRVLALQEIDRLEKRLAELKQKLEAERNYVQLGPISPS